MGPEQERAWAHCRGPLASLWVSLLTAGWNIASPALLATDNGDKLDLLKLAPLDIVSLLKLGL